MPRHKYGAHGCVLRRDVDEVKKDLAEMKATQHEMMKEMGQGIQRLTTAFESLQRLKNTDIVVIAGYNPKTGQYVPSVERFNFFSHTWTQLPGLKIARSNTAAVMLKNQVFVCGGYYNGTYLDSIDVLDLNDNPREWREFFVNFPIKVDGHKCVVYGNRLLVIGGYIDPGGCSDKIYELLLVPPYSSKLLCHMKKKRGYHGVGLFGDKVLIAGGGGAGTDVEIFDITRNECVEMPPLPCFVYNMGTVRRGDTMLLIGGCDNTNKARNEIIEYDFKTGQSKVLLTMKTARSYCSCVFHGNTLIVIGGAQQESAATVDCFNFSSNSWKSLPSMAEARSNACALLVNMDNLEF